MLLRHMAGEMNSRRKLSVEYLLKNRRDFDSEDAAGAEACKQAAERESDEK